MPTLAYGPIASNQLDCSFCSALKVNLQLWIEALSLMTGCNSGHPS